MTNGERATSGPIVLSSRSPSSCQTGLPNTMVSTSRSVPAPRTPRPMRSASRSRRASACTSPPAASSAIRSTPRWASAGSRAVCREPSTPSEMASSTICRVDGAAPGPPASPALPEAPRTTVSSTRSSASGSEVPVRQHQQGSYQRGRPPRLRADLAEDAPVLQMGEAVLERGPHRGRRPVRRRSPRPGRTTSSPGRPGPLRHPGQRSPRRAPHRWRSHDRRARPTSASAGKSEPYTGAGCPGASRQGGTTHG